MYGGGISYGPREEEEEVFGFLIQVFSQDAYNIPSKSFQDHLISFLDYVRSSGDYVGYGKICGRLLRGVFGREV